METTVKCKKCGRVLKNPASIAMGMGPKCAGVLSTKGLGLRIGVRRCSGKAYAALGTGETQIPLLPSHPLEKKISRKELARKQRKERRLLFEQRQSFQCGMVVRTKTLLMYEPVGEKEWKENFSGRIISQEQLQTYLMRYRFI